MPDEKSDRNAGRLPHGLNRVSGAILDAALKVHRRLGPGLLEGVYEDCLLVELRLRGFRVSRQVFVPLEYEGVRIDHALRIDLVVEDAVVVELKSVESPTALHRAQLLSDLRLSGKRLGLLLNFNVALMKDGVVRIAS